MNKSVVSIIIPCYNGADTIARALRGVIQQTYRPIQLILVNDGSTDESDRVIREMEPEICQAGIVFDYIVQENLGLGGAINTGLKYVTGEYLAWVDADDELLPESVAVRANILERNPEYGSVSSNAVMAEDSNWDTPLGTVTNNIQLNSEENQFEHMLLARSIFCCGCHLLRTETFRKANGGMEINPYRYGQNWQMLLPVYYCSKHAFVNQALYKYRINAKSMTTEARKLSQMESYNRRQKDIENICETLAKICTMPNTERKRYIRIFKRFVYEQNLLTAETHKSIFFSLLWKVAIKWLIMLEHHI